MFEGSAEKNIKAYSYITKDSWDTIWSRHYFDGAKLERGDYLFISRAEGDEGWFFITQFLSEVTLMALHEAPPGYEGWSGDAVIAKLKKREKEDEMDKPREK